MSKMADIWLNERMNGKQQKVRDDHMSIEQAISIVIIGLVALIGTIGLVALIGTIGLVWIGREVGKKQ